MKKTKLLLIGGLAVLIGASSCKKDKEVNPYAEPEFTEKSIEDNKTDIQASAITVIQELNSITETKGIKAAANFADIIQISDPFSANPNMSKSPVVGTIKMLAAVEDGKINTSTIPKELKSLTEMSDPESFQDVIDLGEGTYTWNATKQNWDFAAADDKLTMKFPSGYNGNTNDAEITISAKAISNSWEFVPAEERGELPPDIISSISASIKVDGAEIMTFSINAEYKSTGMPTSVTTELTFESIKITAKATNKDTEISSEYKFLNKNKNVLSYGVKATGNFTSEKINATIEKLDDDTEEGDIAAIGEVLNKTEAFVEIANVKIIGTVDATGLANLIEDIEDKEDQLTDEQFLKEMVDALNSKINMFVRYSDGDKIADTEAYIYENTHEYTDYVFDEATYEYVEETVTETRWDMGMRMVFADKSKMDMDAYFADGFEKIEDEINALAEDIKSKIDAEFN